MSRAKKQGEGASREVSSTLKPRKLKQCNCINKVNKSLKEQGTELVVSVVMTKMVGPNIRFKSLVQLVAYPVIEVKRIDSKSRVKLRRLIPNYCPFCGQKTPCAA